MQENEGDYMKVILLAPTPPPAGGIAGWTKRMMQAKLKNGWQVVVVDERVIGGREVFGSKSKKKLHVEIVRCLRIWWDLWKALSDEEATVVHSCIPSATLSMLREYVCALITKLHRRKFIIHFRCTVPNTTKGKFGNWMLRRMCNISDLVMVLNGQTVDYIQPITKTPIVLIPNFIDATELSDQREINPELKNIVYVGGVIAEKGCLEIIEAAKAHPGITFRLVGQPDEEIVAAAQNVSNVFLVGATDRQGVQQELARADAFVFLSYFSGEGFSNALAEAMAAGLPCVVTDWAANADMIEDQGGVVIPVRSAEKAIKAIETIKPQAVRQKMSLFNVDKVNTSYSAAKVLDMYVEAYEMCREVSK